MDVIIEDAEEGDVYAICSLIKELADYERAPHEAELTPQQLLKDGFSENNIFHCFVARFNDEVIGIALTYIKYSTWKGKCVFLEDIIVTESYRGKGIGSLLFNRVAQYAHSLNAARLEWQVLEWNEPAIKFYQKMGATLDPEWVNGKLTRNDLQKKYLEYDDI
jgi:GNAT superfamily N-acetyltransferase